MDQNYQNYIFDLYGTLVDIHTDEAAPRLWERFALYLKLRGIRTSADALREAYRRLCRAEEQRRARALARQGLAGPGEIDLLRVWTALGRENGVRLTRREAEEISLVFRALSIRRLRLFDGAAELLSALRAARKQVVLLTNAQWSFTVPELRALGIYDAFDRIFISSAAGVKKPSPAFFGLLWEAGLRPEESVMVGNDDVCDCGGAASAGMDSIYIRTEQSPAPAGPLPDNCRQIETISDVLIGFSKL